MMFITKINRGKKTSNEKNDKVNNKIIRVIKTKKWRGEINILLEIKIVFALQNPYVLNNLKMFFNEDLLKYETFIIDDKYALNPLFKKSFIIKESSEISDSFSLNLISFSKLVLKHPKYIEEQKPE